jgi:hypothetical protein
MVFFRLFCLFAVFAIALMCLSACEPVGAPEPFFTTKDVIYDHRLEGRWILYGDSRPYEHDEHEIADAPIKFYFWETYGTEKDPTEYRLQAETIGRGSELTAVLFKLDGQTFLDIAPRDRDGLFITAHEYMPNAVRTHILFRVRRQGDALLLAPLSERWTEHHVPDDRRTKSVNGGQVLLLPVAELQTFLRSAMKDPTAFDSDFQLFRKDSEASARDMASYGEYRLATKLLEGGRWAEALEAVRTSFRVRPGQSPIHLFLLLELEIGNLHAEEARRHVKDWMQICRNATEGDSAPPVPSDCLLDGNVSTDVLQAFGQEASGLIDWADGRWEDALRLFQAIPKTKPVAEAIGFHPAEALSLMHLGRKTEAHQLLQEHAGASGDEDEFIAEFLSSQTKRDDFVAKMKALGNSASECDHECRADFYVAEKSYVMGDVAQALEWYQKTLDLKKLYGYEPAVARMRLRQLASTNISGRDKAQSTSTKLLAD